MSRLQPAAAFRHARVVSPDLSKASIANGLVEARKFSDILLLARPKATVDAKALGRRLTVARNTTNLQIQALNWLETRARRASSGDDKAIEELDAVTGMGAQLTRVFIAIARRSCHHELYAGIKFFIGLKQKMAAFLGRKPP